MFLSRLRKKIKDPSSNFNKIIIWVVLPLVIYSVIDFLYFALKNNFNLSHSLFNGGADTDSFVWLLNWWPFAISHGLNPIITKYIWYPAGFNLTWSASIPALSILTLPITFSLNALTSFNIIGLASPVLSSLSMFFLVGVITKKPVPSLLTGYIYGFSTYELGQLLGHPNLYVTFCVPILISLFILRYQLKIKRIIYIILSTLFLCLQFGISTEIFATFLTFSGISLLLLFAFLETEKRIKLLKTTLDLIYSILLSIIILSPYLYFLIKGYKDASASEVNLPSSYSADLLSFIVPTPITNLGHNLFANITSNFSGNFSEEGTYIGLPFLFLVIYIFIKKRKKIIYKFLFILFIILIIASLGPVLHVDGVTKELTLPWNLFTHLPLLRFALPDRFSMYISLVLALIIGMWLSIESSQKITILKYAVVMVGIIFILPNTTMYSWQKVHQPKIFTPNLVSKYISRDSTIMILPFSFEGNGMYYQYVSGMYFKQIGGYVGFTPKAYANNVIINTLFEAPTPNNFKELFVSFCIQNKVSKIIITKGTSSSLIFDLKSINWKEAKVGSSVEVYVPHK